MVVEVRDLVRRFGTFTAVDHVSFEVRSGEIFGLLGPNGAGKTTTFRMLCGLLPASSGTLRVAGVDLRRRGPRPASGSATSPRSSRSTGSFRWPRTSISSPAPTACTAAAGASASTGPCEQFELAAFARLPSGELPGGYKQRLAMAAALLHEPEILFLDEPTSGADPLARREFWRRITALAEQGVTVIVTTHFMEEAEYCDRVAIMDAGQVLAQGTPAEIRSRVPAKPGSRRRWKTPSSPSSSNARQERVGPHGRGRGCRMTAAARSPHRGLSAKLRRVWSLVRKETHQIVRDPSSIAIGIVLPVILILLFGYGLSLDVKDVPVAVVLEDPSPDATEVAGGFQLSPYFDARLLTSMPQAEQLMLAREGRRHRPHPPRLRAAVEAGRRRGADPGSRHRRQPGPDHPGLRPGRGRRVDGPAGRRRAERARRARSIVRDRLWFNEANDSHYFLVPGLIVLVMTLIGALLTALVMAREWERGTLESLFVTPVRADEILLGKTIPYFALGMIGLALCLLAAKFLFHVPFRGSIWVLAGVSMLYLLVALGIGLLDLLGHQEPVRGQPDHAAGHLPAGVHALGVPVRPAEHAGRGPRDHDHPAGPLLRRRPADGFPGRRRLGRHPAQRGRAGRHGGRRAAGSPSHHAQEAGLRWAMFEAIFRILSLTRKELLAVLKDPRGRFTLFVPPIFQCLIFGYAATLRPERRALCRARPGPQRRLARPAGPARRLGRVPPRGRPAPDRGHQDLHRRAAASCW